MKSRMLRPLSTVRFLMARLAVLAGFVFVLLVPCHAQNPISQFEWLGFLPNTGTAPPFPQGAYTYSNLAEIKPGIFVGTAQQGGPDPEYSACPAIINAHNCGTIYQIDTTTVPATITLLHAFSGILPDGSFEGGQPTGNIEWDGKYIYGTTMGFPGCLAFGVSPPKPSCGTIYRFDPNALSLTTLYTIDGASPGGGLPPHDGVSPSVGVTLARKGPAAGHLFIPTSSGGDKSGGVLYEYVDPSTVGAGTRPEKVYILDPVAIGSNPQALTEYADENLYFATSAGAEAVLQFNTSSEKINLCGTAKDEHGNYANLVGKLAAGADGALYGAGNFLGSGGIFRMDVSGGCTGSLPLTTVHSFTATGSDVGNPGAGILASSSGVLYGTGAGSSGANIGMIYDVAPPYGKNDENALYTSVNNGSNLTFLDPRAELQEGIDGWIYGASISAPQHGLNSNGAMFRFLPPPFKVLQFGTTGVLDAGGPIAVDARPSVLPGTDATPAHPGPRIYIAGESGSNLAAIYGGQGSGGFFLARYFQDGTLDTSFGPTNIAMDNGGFLQFGPSTVSRSNPDYVAAVAVDNSGNVLLAGSTTVGVFGCTTNQGGADIWVASFSPGGGFQWCKMFGSSKDDSAVALTFDGGGNLYVAGSTNGAPPANTLAGTTDAFIAKIGPKGNHLLVIHQFAVDGQTLTGASGIAFCGGHLYVAGNAGDSAGTSAWLSEFEAADLFPVSGATQNLSAGYSAGPVATDSKCNVDLGAGFFAVQGSIAKEFFALQQYNKTLSRMLWKKEADGPQRTAEGSQILYPESILTLAVDKTDTIYAGGGTNFSLYGRPLPAPPQATANCDTIPLVYCAGWFAAYNSSTGDLFTRSPQEFGNVETAIGALFGGGSALAVDEYGKIHVAGETVGPLVAGGEFDNSVDAFEMDFLPVSLCNGSCQARTSTTTALSANAIAVAAGSTVTFTANVSAGGTPVKTGGLVSFISDGFAPGGYTVLGNVAVSKAAATAGTAKLGKKFPKGKYNVIAIYGGTTALAPSNGAPIWTVTVQ